MEIIVILHNIRSIHNVGSIFRTSDAAGVSKIYLVGTTPTPLDRFGFPRKDLAKVALGAEKDIPWEYSGDTLEVIKKLREKDFKIVSLEQDKKSTPYTDIKKLGLEKIALILGDEVNGIGQEILDGSDVIAEIPMSGKKESLNVSVSFGIAVYDLIQT